PKTSLRIDLGVRVEISVPVRALDAERHVIGRAVWIQVLVVVTENVGVVVRNSQTRRNSPAIVCRTDIPCVRCLPLQRWRISAQRYACGGRMCVTVVRGETDAAEHSWQE